MQQSYIDIVEKRLQLRFTNVWVYSGGGTGGWRHLPGRDCFVRAMSSGADNKQCKHLDFLTTVAAVERCKQHLARLYWSDTGITSRRAASGYAPYAANAEWSSRRARVAVPELGCM